MAEKYRFFDSTLGDTRQYPASDFADYFSTIVLNGIFSKQLNGLKPTASGNAMTTFIDTGKALIQGYYYENDTSLTMTHAASDPTYDRIDRLVIRLDTSARTVLANILQGTPAASPSAPTLTRSGNIYEISLAQVRITAGKSFIDNTQITDERKDNSVAGYCDPILKTDIIPYFPSKSALSGLDGDVTISANASMTRKVMFYNNLTVNSGVTLSANGGGLNIIYVSGTLTLNGTIKALTGGAGGASVSASGAGGQGGGAILVFANSINGTGTITASGANGSNASASTASNVGQSGTNGAAGSFLGNSVPNGAGGGTAASTSASGGTTPTNLRPSIDLFLSNFLSTTSNDTGAGGGASGASCSGVNAVGNGGAGGAGFIGNGGNGGTTSTVSMSASTGGGAGGGGGLTVVYSKNSIPPITISADGGSGGAGTGAQYGGGGGGGGGYVLVIAPTSTANLSAVGGTAGATLAGGTAASNGGAGMTNFVTL